MFNKSLEEEKKNKSQEQQIKNETKGGVNKLKKEVGETIKETEKKEIKGKLDNLKKEVGEKHKESKNKYRRWREKYKKELKKIGISLTNDDRENIVKNHNKKEIKHFYKDLKKAIKKDKIKKFLKKWKNKGYDELLAKLSEKNNKKPDKEKNSKSSNKEKNKTKSHKKEITSTESNSKSSETENSSTESNSKSSETENSSTESNSKSSETENSSTEPNNESSKTAEVGELAKVPESKEARMKRLFPEGTPKSKEEMEKYLTKIEIPVRTQDGKEDKLKLNIHVKLAEEIKAIFKEMYDKNIPVNPKKTGAFCWRKVRRGNSMSQHSYGSAIDVNYNVNGGVYGKTDKNSPYFNGKETVDIWKKHGFFRGGDWSAKSNDPMHFGFYNG